MYFRARDWHNFVTSPRPSDASLLCLGVYYTNGTPTATIAPVYVAPSYSYVIPSYVVPNTTSSGYPPNTVISTYYDPRYGVVSVVTDSGGNLININAATGQRIFPIFPDYGYGYGYLSGYYRGIPYVNPNIAACPIGNYSCLRNAYFGRYYPFYPGFSYRLAEVAQPAAVAEPAPVAPSPAVAPVAPVANLATGLNTSVNQAPASSSDGSGVRALGVQATTTPSATFDGRDDGK